LGSKKSKTFSKVCHFFKWRGWKIKKCENVNFWRPCLLKVAFSQNREGQPTIKFHRQHNETHIYRRIPRNKHVYDVCGLEHCEKPSKSDQLEWFRKWQVI
jgi:hypothetical protein